jgi:NAD(P)-dependent dehydrogenase (short-subunit alcohol dehydrogenase family)
VTYSPTETLEDQVAEQPNLVVIGGTAGIGKEIARRAAVRGDEVVLTGRAIERAESVAAEIGGRARGLTVELSRPHELTDQLSGLDRVDHLVLSAIDRDENTAADYDVDRALALVTLKLVGYTEVVHVLHKRISEEGSIVVFGGMAAMRPYPGSTTVSTVNGGVVGLVHSLAVELAPIRVNAIHPGIVGDSPYWSGKPPEVLERYRSRTPTGRLATMGDIADAVEFLLRNRAVNGVNLDVNGGTLLL